MKNIYLCGPTVYQDVHIGNVRPIMVFDLVVRAMRASGQKVLFIHNITDIDDKIVAKAVASKTTEAEIGKKYYLAYRKVLRSLNIVSPDVYPRVTTNLKRIIHFIKRIVDARGAYIAPDGVYFNVAPLQTYGSVSGQNVNMLLGAAKAARSTKHSPHDFALWKVVSEGVKYPSPWGEGRPGWHTECAALIDKYFGAASVTIHGGGIDLVFPHHENENAQYVVANDVPIAEEWRHVGTLNFAGTKMSKSLGNIILAKDFIAEHGADVLRFLFLSSSYSAPLDITDALIEQTKKQVMRLSNVYMRSLLLLDGKSINNATDSPRLIAFTSNIASFDFSAGLRILNEIISGFEKQRTIELASEVVGALRTLGFMFTRKQITESDRLLLAEWESLRSAKNYNEADKKRQILAKKGLV